MTFSQVDVVSEVLGVTYSRSSSARQKSIDDQRAANREVCVVRGWVVSAELDDPSSASRYGKKVRQNWARLLELLPGIDVVVMWEPSRGDRTLSSWASFLDLCREHGVRIHAVSHDTTYDPRNARHYRSLAEDGVDSAYESDKTAQRIRRGQATAAADGRPHGRVTFGYERIYDKTTRKFVEQVEHPVQGLVVRNIFAALASGESVTSVLKRLTVEGVATPCGAVRWYPTTVRTMVANRAYRGLRVYAGQEYPAVWPALVEDRVWHAVQRVMGASTQERAVRKANAPGAVKYLLSGSLAMMTAPCGNTLRGIGDLPGRLAHYVCSLDSCVSVSMRECDEYVTRLVVARFSRKDVRDMWVVDDAAARAAGGELAGLRAKLVEARESFALPGGLGISAASLAHTERTLEPLIEDAQRRARPTGVSLAVLHLLDAAKMGKDKVRPVWDAMPIPAKREIVSGMFDALILGISPELVTRWTTSEEKFDLVARRVKVTWRRSAALTA